MSSPSVHTDGISDSPDVSMDEEALQEVTTNLSQVSLVIDTVKKKADDDRNDYIKKRMVENRSKMAEITTNHHNLSVEKGKLKVSNENRKVNLLLQRMQEAIAKQNGAVISSSPVILLAPEIDVKDTIRPITLPKVEKIPPYTTWTFLGRNQIMTEDQSVVGRRRIYYDQNGGEALICSDSEEDVNDEEEDKKEFVDSEDKIIRSTIEQVGSSDAVYDLLAQRLSRKPCEIKARYEDLVSGKNATESSKSGDTDFNMSSYLDKDLEAAMDTFDRIFCRRCLIFDCKLHGCSQDLIFPAEKCSTQNNVDEELVSSEPCGPHCYLQVQTTALSSNASGDLVIKEKTSGPSLRKRLKSHKSGNASSNAENDSENSDSYTTPDKNKRARKCVTRQSGSKERSSSPLKENSPSTRMYRRKHSFVPTSDQLSIGSNETVKKDEFIEKSVSRQVTDFETWRTMEKSLFEKGLEIFGKNSCLIAMNVMFGLKTCVEVFNALQNNENKGDESTNSQDKCSRIESSENKGTALRTRSSFFRRRSRVRRLKFTSVKSAGSYSMRKRISDKSNLHCRQYNPCGCRSICGNDCSCFANGTACEKYCGCPKNCRNRFRGCLCGKGQCRNSQCPCFAANRECDPDVCRNCWINCGDGTVVKKGENYECENMKLLLRQQQRVILGRSDVSGWGAFLKNDVSKDEYLGEYTGELISHHEADKRGKIYDRENSSFLFNLNDQFVLDAYRKGDKLKFANHSPKPNCYAKVMMVAGDHRVGIFAKENIAAGQELFYDYRYEHDKAPAWAKKPGDSSTRNEDNASSSNGRAKKLASVEDRY